MLDSETKKALVAILFIVKRSLQREEFSLKDFENILICLTGLIKTAPFVSKFLKWLGRFTQMREVQEGAKKYGGLKAVWGLNLFGKIVRKL